MTARVAVSIRRSVPADRPAVLALLAAALGWRDDEGLPEFFDWKHHGNPFGESPAWVAADGDRIVGFRTFLRWEFETSGGTRRAVRAVDTATHPDSQGRGVFRSLTLTAVEEMTAEGVDFVFNTPNDKSRPGYLSMGWEQVGRVGVAVRVVNPRGAIRMLRSRVPAGRWPIAGATGYPAHEVLADDRVATLLERLAPPTTCLRTRRTREYLRWRYGYEPLGYRAIAAGEDPAAGLVVYRLRARGQAREAAVCEILVPDHSPATAGRLCREIARTSGADYVIRLGGAAPRSGFLPLPGQGPVLTWRALASVGAAPPLPAWQLTLGDVELL